MLHTASPYRGALQAAVTRCGGTAIGQFTGDTRPTLAEHRNTLAHGDPFESLPTGGLLELVRDLINFAYRDYIAEAPRPEFLASTVMSTTDFIGATKWVES